MTCAVIIQQAKELHGGVYEIATKIIGLDSGEVLAEEVIVRPGFAWDNAVEAALDEAVKHAESAGVKDIRIDSPFWDAIQKRKKMLKDLTEVKE